MMEEEFDSMVFDVEDMDIYANEIPEFVLKMTNEEEYESNFEPLEDMDTTDDLEIYVDDLSDCFIEQQKPEIVFQPINGAMVGSERSQVRQSLQPFQIEPAQLHSLQGKRVYQKNERIEKTPGQLPAFVESVSDQIKYDEAFSKLAESMKRSQISRLASAKASPQPSITTMSSLTGFLSGERSTLTVGLEHSRLQLRAYMSQMVANQYP